ncbi:MAG: hypothetical protein WEA09_02490 [Gemmatimonadota bacterium]
MPTRPRFLIISMLVLVTVACQDRQREARTPGEFGDWEEVPGVSLVPVPAGTGNASPGIRRITLESADVSPDTTSLALASAIAWWGERLVVADQRAADPLQIWDAATLVREQALGRRGQGPNEFIAPFLWDQAGDGPPVIWDFDQRRLTALEVVGGTVTLGTARQLDLPVSLLEFATDGGRIWASGLSADFTVLELSASLVPTRRIVLPPPHEVPNPTGRRLANRSFLAISPQGDELVVAYQFANRLDLIMLEADSVLTFPGPIPTTARYSVSEGRFFWEEGNEIAYLGVQHAGDRIYAAFCGCGLDRDPVGLPTAIHVFRPDGEALAILEIGLPFTAFAVDPDQARIALVVEDPVPRLVMMEMPQELVR